MEEIGLVEALDHAVEWNARLPALFNARLEQTLDGRVVGDVFLYRLLDTIQILQAGDNGAADLAPEQHFAMALNDVFKP